MQILRATFRFVLVVVHILRGWLKVKTRFSRLDKAQQEALVQDWALGLLDKLSIKLIVKGAPPKAGPVLMVSNHISWADITVLHAVRHCRFVSKSDVKHWPIVAALSAASGTLYIERESRRDAMRVVHHMTDALRETEVLAVFPEGTTGDGTHLLPFHANLFQAAIAADAPIQPVALRYVDATSGKQSFAPCYLGNDTLVQSLWRTLCAKDLVAEVSFGEPQQAEGRDRRAWAQDARKCIETLRTG